METNTAHCTREEGPVMDPVQEGLMEMSQAELKLMQEVALYQSGDADGNTRLVLMRVWHRLEQERCRRKADIEALERMYFGR